MKVQRKTVVVVSFMLDLDAGLSSSSQLYVVFETTCFCTHDCFFNLMVEPVVVLVQM